MRTIRTIFLDICDVEQQCIEIPLNMGRSFNDWRAR